MKHKYIEAVDPADTERAEKLNRFIVALLGQPLEVDQFAKLMIQVDATAPAMEFAQYWRSTSADQFALPTTWVLLFWGWCLRSEANKENAL